MAPKVRYTNYCGRQVRVAHKVISPLGERVLVVEKLILLTGKVGTMTSRGLVSAESDQQLLRLLQAHFEADRILIALTTAL